MTAVNTVNLTYKGKKESLRFTHEPDKKVSDIRQYFFKWSDSKYLHRYFYFSALKKHYYE